MGKQQSGGGKFVVGTIIGAAVGAVAALLTAPKSGKETRADLKEKATEVSHEAMRQLRKVEGELNKRISDAKKMAGKLEGQAKAEVEVVIAKAEKAKAKALKMIDDIKDDTKKQLDDKFMEDAKDIVAELQALQERMGDRRTKK